MMRWVRRIGVLVNALGMVCAGAVTASAQSCTVSIDPMNFGSFKLSNLASATTVATLSASCTGEVNQTVRICPAISSGDIGQTGGGNYALRLTLYSDVAHTMVWQDGLDIMLDGTGAGTASRAVYGRLSVMGNGARAGAYSGVVMPGYFGGYVATGGTLCSAPAGAPAAAFRGGVRRTATSPAKK